MDDGIPAMYKFSSGSGVGKFEGRSRDNAFPGLVSTFNSILSGKKRIEFLKAYDKRNIDFLVTSVTMGN